MSDPSTAVNGSQVDPCPRCAKRVEWTEDASGGFWHYSNPAIPGEATLCEGKMPDTPKPDHAAALRQAQYDIEQLAQYEHGGPVSSSARSLLNTARYILDLHADNVLKGQEIIRLERQLEQARKDVLRLVKALHELHATVEGECPSLLNEDSGGDAELAIEIECLLPEIRMRWEKI